MFWTNLSKSQVFYEILNFNLVILTIFLKGNLAFIWPFFIFQDLAFFESAYGQIWPNLAKFGLFNFFEPGNPVIDRDTISLNPYWFVDTIC